MRKHISAIFFVLCSIVACLIFVSHGCTSLQSVYNEPLHKEPIPRSNEDVLWVSSIPIGAKVFVFEKQEWERFALDPNVQVSKKPLMKIATRGSENTDARYEVGPFSHEPVGITPLTIKVPPDTYYVGIQLDVASENIPFQFFNSEVADSEDYTEVTKLYTDAKILDIYANLGTSNVGSGEFDSFSPYVYDGNLELWALYSKGLLQKVGKTYEIEKKPGEAATVIALFQRKNENPDKVYEALPEEYRFNKRFLAGPDICKIWGVSKTMSKQFSRRLLRGGKALLYDSQGNCILAELTPLGPTTSGKGERGGVRFVRVGEFSEK